MSIDYLSIIRQPVISEIWKINSPQYGALCPLLLLLIYIKLNHLIVYTLLIYQSSFALGRNNSPTTMIEISPQVRPPTHNIAIAIKGEKPLSFVKVSYKPTAQFPLLMRKERNVPTGPNGPKRKATGSSFSYPFNANWVRLSFDLFPSNLYVFHPSTKKNVGKPCTENRDANARSAAPSTFATLILRLTPAFCCLVCNSVAICSYVDANRTQ